MILKALVIKRFHVGLCRKRADERFTPEQMKKGHVDSEDPSSGTTIQGPASDAEQNNWENLQGSQR